MPDHDREDRIDERLARTRLLVLDVDGVLTDGRVTYLEGGQELQSFNVHDGAAFAWLREAGVEIAWITGRGSEATRRRAKELGVTELHMQARPKGGVLERLQLRLEIDPSHTTAMGDDLHDFALRRRAAVFVCPANARDEVRERAHIITEASGGAGAVRELAERILRTKGLWEKVVAGFDDKT
jgi:3-deoxy-D-manno-octulosonate 8-phosphate phosphatase (KDO 8-P phosphatase)